MKTVLLLCIVAWTSASCPCDWDVGTSNLDCSNRALKEVPTECFDTYTDVKLVNLTSNLIDELKKDDFSVGVDILERLIVDDNPLYYIHPDVFASLHNLLDISIKSTAYWFNSLIQPRLFWTNSKLQKVTLGTGVSFLPMELFSPNLTEPVTLHLEENARLLIPCKTLSNLPDGSQVFHPFDDGYFYWAQTTKDAHYCTRFNLSYIINQCKPQSDYFIDCYYIPEDMTPVTTEFVQIECNYQFGYCAPEIIFPAAFHELLSEIPEDYSCLPEGVDKIWDFRVYYQNSEHIELDTLYFDLADLRHYTSEITKSVSIRAETVVLTRNMEAIKYELNIFAGTVALRFPILSHVYTSFHDPSVDQDYFTLRHELGKIGDLVVKKLHHGNVHITLLGYGEEPCTAPPDWSDILPQSTSLAQLDLAVQCSVSLRTRDDYEALKAALAMSSWAESLAIGNTLGGMDQVRSRATAVRISASSHLTRANYTDPLPVPYLSLSVYAAMVEGFSENVKIFKDTIDKMQNKLERQSEFMFDLSMTFEERHADLEFVYQESNTAINQAQSVLGNQQNHLNNLRSYADSTYNLVFSEYDKFLASSSRYETAFKAFETGIQNAKDSAFIRGCVGFFVNLGKCIMQKEYPNPSDIANSIQEAGETKREFADLEDEMEESMLLVNELMRNVAEIMASLEAMEPPNGDGGTDWAAAFPDTTQLLNAAQSQLVSKPQWDMTTRGAIILLDDSDMIKVSGSAQYRAAVVELAGWGKSLSEKIVSFAQLILQITDEEEDLKVAELGVQQATEKSNEVAQMMSTSETNQDNYLSLLNQQNNVIMGLMLDFYTKNRVDMLNMARVLDEFCQAYRYNFFLDCPPSTQPTAGDDYDTILLKLTKLQVNVLNSLSILTPPPQPFKKTFDVAESFPCDEALNSCPVTSLKSSGTATVTLSDWWGSELEYFDRVRIDTLRLFLVGGKTPEGSSVILKVSQPAVFNDTFTGKEETFTGHVTECLIMYRQDDSTESISDASFLTDCSTHHNYDQYYSRSTPRGEYTITVVSTDTDLSGLENIQVYVEGSWMPHSKAKEEIDSFFSWLF